MMPSQNPARKYRHLCRLLIHVLVMHTSVLCDHTASTPTGCLLDKSKLSCDHELPAFLPHGVTDVYIKDYIRTDPIQIPHADRDWAQIKTIDIVLNPEGHSEDSNLNPKVYSLIDDGAFETLYNLRYLGIHGWLLDSLPPDVFVNLTKLEELDLSGCGSLIPATDVLPQLARAFLPHLKVLNLNYVRARYGNQIHVGYEFINILYVKNITKLCIRGTNLLFKTGSSLNLLDKPLAVEDLDFSGITAMFTSATDIAVTDFAFSNVRTVNISSIDSRYQLFKFGNVENVVFDLCASGLRKGLEKLENIYADNLASDPKGQSVNNVTYYMNSCDVKLTRFHLRANKIFKMNATVFWPLNNTVIESDLSDNEMKYLSPKFLGGLIQLQNLFLANNNLNNMEAKPEFGDLLKSFTKLRHFSIAGNQLSRIPRYMFSNNRNLRVLELQRNNLETITFDVANLIHIERLDLTENKFKYLEANVYRQLSALLNVNTSSKQNVHPDIKFEDNPFECTCDSVEFLEWMTTVYLPLLSAADDNTAGYRCELEDDVTEINMAAIEQAQYLCYKTAIIISVNLSCCVMAILIIVIIFIIRRIRHKRHTNDILNTFLEAFKDKTLKCDNTVVRFIVFLSYCSEDEAVAVNVVRPNLEKTFRENTNGDGDTVCLGVKHFRPGFPVIGEVMRCVSESCVAIFIVSQAFCLSDWCGLEVQEAVQQRKPMVLIFTERVNEQQMTWFVRRVFQRYTRAKLVLEEGQYQLEPSWRHFCDSVIMLAAEVNWGEYHRICV